MAAPLNFPGHVKAHKASIDEPTLEKNVVASKLKKLGADKVNSTFSAFKAAAACTTPPFGTRTLLPLSPSTQQILDKHNRR
jgi:hypothetical protein